LHWLNSYRYLARLNVPTTEAERGRVETLLGALRVLIAVLALVAFTLDRPEPARYAHLVYILLAVWVAHSVGVLAWVSRRAISPSFLLCLHCADIFWPTLITTYSHGPSSPFIPIYSFALLSAGFRWGFPEAVLTSVAGGVVLEVEALFLGTSALGEFEGNRLLVRCAYLLALGTLIGTLGENEKERRAESAVVTRMLHAARSEHSMRAVLQSVFSEYIGLFDPARLFLVAHDLASDRVYLWQMTTRPHSDAQPYSREVLEEDRFGYLLPQWPGTFFCKQQSATIFKMRELAPRARAVEKDGRIPLLPFMPPETRSLLAATAPLGHEWELRLLLCDARLGRGALQEMSFAQLLFEQAAQAIYSVYLMRRLRARASALERSRVARELHDGAIQSLISAEMRSDILRRRAEKESPAMAAEIGSLQDLLRGQVIELRKLMQQLKPVEIAPEHLLDQLAEQVERFRRDSGIAAQFVSTAEHIQLSGQVCREILLIVQEALVNIRKHARAAEVLVSFGRHDGYWRLSVSDDGVGFGFEGTLAGTELMKSARGPAIIKERVAEIGGELQLESSPSRGSRLLIKLPQKGNGSHG
jgi:signal transduction histidine kinase